MFEVAIVEDFSKDGAFDDAMKGEFPIIWLYHFIDDQYVSVP
jgi:hypothetical protein